jgi:peptidoglycan/xylan/chitin deacetylase (PgdA/CDA1 family)
MTVSVGDAPLAGWAAVLMYHRIVPQAPASDPHRVCTRAATFESHLRWLRRRGYASVSLPELARQLDGHGPEAPAAHGPSRRDAAHRRTGRPARSVAITFDDGYQDTFLCAWPLLQRYGFSATVFVVTDAIGGWNDFDQPAGSEPARMLSAAELQALHRASVDVGSHSCSHPASLVDLPEPALRDELSRSRATLEGILDAPVAHFAYPHSRHDARVEDAVRAAGYRLACAGTGTRSSRFRLHRVAAPLAGGPAVECATAWRYLKWRVRGWL